ncbi:MAG: hypothetical protein GF421_06875 [Candidatus Aminicenantes bacterium]|nr:hypothetical protein [Candidatus Aminicenantes bacterium]
METGRSPYHHNQSFKGKIWKDGSFVKSKFYIKDGKIHPGITKNLYEAAYIIPPFADPHIHGGWGYDFEQGDFASLENKLKQNGVFCAVPTISCSSLNKLKRISGYYQKYRKDNPHSIFPFLRAEGPFINPIKKGSQEEKNILTPTPENIEELLSIKNFKVHTFAPEMDPLQLMVKKALQVSKIPSAGHSQAQFRDFLKHYDLGLRHMTHYPNAMSGLHHREIGLTGAGLVLKDLQLEVIADSIHNSMDFFSLLLQIKGPAICLTSDLIPPAYSKSQSILKFKISSFGRKITVKDNVLAGGGTLVSEQAKALFDSGIKPEEIIPLVCTNALDFFGLSSFNIKPGRDANFIVLNKSFEIQAVYENGELFTGDQNWKTA